MEEEIINRVAQSKLITFDLESIYPAGNRLTLDIAQWLDQGFILREKSFRESLQQHDWHQYQDGFVAIFCSTDAIVPAWAFMLVTSKLTGIATKVVSGTLETLETILFSELINSLDLTPYEGVPVIIKGCSEKPVPENAYILLTQRLQTVARSLMFGEACSSVPLFKKAKNS